VGTIAPKETSLNFSLRRNSLSFRTACSAELWKYYRTCGSCSLPRLARRRLLFCEHAPWTLTSTGRFPTCFLPVRCASSVEMGNRYVIQSSMFAAIPSICSCRYSHTAIPQLRENETRKGEEGKLFKDLLVAPARGCLTSWANGNRPECAYLLSHISGSGPRVHDIVLHTCRLMKKVRRIALIEQFNSLVGIQFTLSLPPVLQMNAGRLIEAHYHCLTLVFGTWLEATPFLDSDHPSEAELEKFYEDEQKHRTKVRTSWVPYP
jgi:hypothetical protein